LTDVNANVELRKKLDRKSGEELAKILSKLDKKRLKEIDPRNKIRLIRAIEIATALGRVPSLKKQPLYESLQIGLDISDKELRGKILKRIRARMKKGMLAEARRLHAKGLSHKKMREFGLEYRHLADLLEKHPRNPSEAKVALAEFERLLELDIWHYAKRRQRAWFKRDNRLIWLTPADIQKASKKVKAFMR